MGSGAWTGTEQDWLGVEGAEMYWSHADSQTYKAWLAEAGMELLTDEHIAEAGSQLGHHVFYAKRKPDSLE